VKILISALISLVAHFVAQQLLGLLPELEPTPTPVVATMEVHVTPPPPPPPPPPEPPKPAEPSPPPKPTPAPPREVPHPQPKAATSAIQVAPKDAPPAEHPTVVVPDPGDEPVFNGGPISINSTSQGPSTSGGPATSKQTDTNGSGGHGTSAHGEIGAFEATKMPLPQGRCFGKYTEEAKAAGVEGTVVLDLVVDENGHAREIQVVSGLANGLTEAAVTALKQCSFSPGEKDGARVAVKIRGFKIRFVLAEAN
jgi:periplasmic protein TonB